MGIKASWIVDASYMMEDAGFTPDPWQRGVLRDKSSRLALLCPRQTGKSQVVAVKALHHALMRDDALVLLVSRAQDQSENLHRKILHCYNALGCPVPGRQLKESLELDNGSRIIALPDNAATVRSHSSTLLVLDEAAQIKPAMIIAVLPMILATTGDIWILSTPHGPSGYFYEEWTNPRAAWKRVSVRVDQCPRFDPVAVADIRRQLGDDAARQELDGEFVSSAKQCFSTSSIERAFESTVSAIPGF